MHTIKNWAEYRSKDPNTKVGACVYDVETGGMFLGYNGFNKGMADLKSVWDNRDHTQAKNKYAFVVHAETNAIRKAQMALGLLDCCTLYVTHFPCHNCMKDTIVPSGIKNIVYGIHYPIDNITVDMASMHDIHFERLEV
jgi:dCMP deaminase